MSQWFSDIINWSGFKLVEATAPEKELFTFSDYLTALALVFVVIGISDFRYRYRLSLHRFHLKRILTVQWLVFGCTLLLIDYFTGNNIKIPAFLNHALLFKLTIGIISVGTIFYVYDFTFNRTAKFNRWNARLYLDYHAHLIHQGNPDKLVVVAEEIPPALDGIIEIAATVSDGPRPPGAPALQIPDHVRAAHSMLLLIGAPSFCKLVVEKCPSMALALVETAEKHPRANLPISQFLGNVGRSFIENTNSSFYMEVYGHESGLLGYQKPVTEILFSNYKLIERNSEALSGIFYISGEILQSFSRDQFEGYTRAALAFTKSYLEATKGLHRSRAFANILETMERAASNIYVLDGIEKFDWRRVEYQNFGKAVDFIRDTLDMMNASAEAPYSLKLHNKHEFEIHDQIANVIFEILHSAGTVTTPTFDSWSIHYNQFWSELFGHHEGPAFRRIRLKIRRLIYDEIKDMEQYPNYKHARIFSLLLNVLGVRIWDAPSSFVRDFRYVHRLMMAWMKANYATLLRDRPKLANAFISGFISYDTENNRLVKTYSGENPKNDYFDLDPPRLVHAKPE